VHLVKSQSTKKSEYVKYSSSVELPVSHNVVLPFVNDLSQYPKWMPLVHSVESDGDDSWNVELRAKVGVFARSKRIRMTRTVNTANELVFERNERDGRQHSPWRLAVSLTNSGSSTAVTMYLEYGGTLWTAGVLDRVLASQVDAGKANLAAVVQGA
jgi:carbon monoxide dehydrogenase subunit G